jgi:hypothetical protein
LLALALHVRVASMALLLLKEVLKWMDAHDDVLPKRHRQPTPDQQEETVLGTRYENKLPGSNKLTMEEQALQRKIDRRKTDPADLKTIADAASWSAQHNNTLPMHSRDDHQQLLLAKRLRKLQQRKNNSPVLQKRLQKLFAEVHRTPTKAAARGAIHKLRKSQAHDMLSHLHDEHVHWLGGL